MTTVTVADDSYSVTRSYISSIQKNPSYSLQPVSFVTKKRFSNLIYLRMRMADWMLPPFQQPTSLENFRKTPFSLTGSWTTTQRLLIGWIEIDSFYPWVPGAPKSSKKSHLLRFGDVKERRAGNDFAGTKRTKKKWQEMAIAWPRIDNVILDVHPSSIIKKSQKMNNCPSKCGNWLCWVLFERTYDV